MLKRGMDFRQIAQCKKSLNFKPDKGPHIISPAFSWGDELLTGFNAPDETPVVDLEQLTNFKTWHEAMASLYGEISFVEFARLNHCVQGWDKAKLLMRKTSPSWAQSFGFNEKEDTLELCECVLQMPEQFQTWASEKKLSFRELRPLRLLKNEEEEQRVLNTLAINGFSRNEGAYALELLVELLLMEKPKAALQKILEEPPHVALEQLRKLRYPKRWEKQDAIIQKAQKLSWPRRSQSKWNFLKDSPSLELKFLIHNEEEFHQLVDQLNLIKDKMSEDSVNPWK